MSSMKTIGILAALFLVSAALPREARADDEASLEKRIEKKSEANLQTDHKKAAAAHADQKKPKKIPKKKKHPAHR